jgi:dipeptidyl-peptidase-4
VSGHLWRERYARAQAMLRAPEEVANGAVFPHWLDDGRFWYRRRGADGIEVRIVDAATGEGRTLFRQADVAHALGAQIGRAIDPGTLVLGDLAVEPVSLSATFVAFDQSFVYRPADRSIAVTDGDRGLLVSPDGRLGLFLRGHDLWLRDRRTGESRPLTTDGSEANAYGMKPMAMRLLGLDAQIPARLDAVWSPDSSCVLTVQVDERHVPELAGVDFVPEDGLRPQVATPRVSMPGDARVTELRIVSIDVASGAQTEPRHPRLVAVRMNDTPLSGNLAWWSADARTAYFVDVERGERAAHVVAFDVTSGEARIVFTEHAETYVELSPIVYEPAPLRPMPATNEVVWWSERTGHGHLYLYDLERGECVRAVTSGPWQVRHVHHVDAERRRVFFTAAGIATGEDPYTCRPCVVSLDGGPVTVVSDEPGDHLVWRIGDWSLAPLDTVGENRWEVSGVSPGGSFFVETVGSVDRLPRTVLRRRDGTEVAVLEEASGLPAEWIWPEPVEVIAADGVTHLHGILLVPPAYDPAGSYPVIDLIYGGPQVSWVPKSAFAHGGFGTDLQLAEAAHLASLGAFVLLVDGRGTAGRERAFHEASYGAIHTASNVDDHVAALQQLAERHPAMDLERVAVCGFSGGGYAAALAALRRGDVYKVAVAGGGNYDQRLFWRTWGERYHGAFDDELYAVAAVKTRASGLQGKLLLIHGLLDAACSPAGMFQLLQALIDENKDVDVVIEPQVGHWLGGYGLRRRLDYLVTHLFSSTPPTGVRIVNPRTES